MVEDLCCIVGTFRFRPTQVEIPPSWFEIIEHAVLPDKSSEDEFIAHPERLAHTPLRDKVDESEVKTQITVLMMNAFQFLKGILWEPEEGGNTMREDLDMYFLR